MDVAPAGPGTAAVAGSGREGAATDCGVGLVGACVVAAEGRWDKVG